MSKKIFFAIGDKVLEDYLLNKLGPEYEKVGATGYREAIVSKVSETKPDILLILETLPGSDNILKIAYKIRNDFPDVRIIFLASKREIGDAFLSTLVGMGIYDLLFGGKHKVTDILRLIKEPQSYQDVKHLQPAPELDEKTNKVIFKAPDPIVIKEQINIGKEAQPESENLENANDSNEDDGSLLSKINSKVVGVISNIREDEKNNNNENDVNTNTRNKQNPKNKPIQTSLKKKKASKKRQAEINTVKQNIVSFWGGKDGVGASSLAINTATALASLGYKIIYVEVDNLTPTIGYWYQISSTTKGLENALEFIKKEDYAKVEECIIKMKNLKKSEDKHLYKKFPDKLDFMLFSNQETLISKLTDKFNKSLIRDLFMALIFQLDYDFVIIDVRSDINNPFIQSSLMYSNIIFNVSTQDVSTIGYSKYKIDKLKKEGILVKNKISYIINRYEKKKVKFLINEINSWLGTNKTIVVPNNNNDFINANYYGIPVYSISKDKDLKKAIDDIVRTILSN